MKLSYGECSMFVREECLPEGPLVILSRPFFNSVPQERSVPDDTGTLGVGAAEINETPTDPALKQLTVFYF